MSAHTENQAIENIEKIVQSLEMAQQILADLQTAVRQLQGVTAGQGEKIRRLENIICTSRQ